ncbi:MAG: tetratricopeptide repeat protein [Gemmataceae bacterium]
MKFMQIVRTSRKWWFGRRFGLLIGGLPAVCVGIFVVIISILSYSRTKQEARAEYRSLAEKAFANKDYVSADLYYKRLASWTGGQTDVLLRLALIADKLKDVERSQELFRLVIATDGKEAADAHLWLGSQYISDGGTSIKNIRLAKYHLLTALRGPVKDRAKAEYFLGRIFLAEKNYDDAELYFLRIANRNPHTHYYLAVIYYLTGKKDRFRRHVRLAISHFQPRAESDTNDHESRLAWGKCVVLQEDYAKAEAIFREGIANTTTSSDQLAYTRHLALLYLRWSDAQAIEDKGEALGRVRPSVWFALMGNPGLAHQICYIPAIFGEVTLSPNLGDRLVKLEQAIRLDPTNPILINRFLAMTRSDGALETKLLQQRFRRLLAEGKPSAAAHFALGVLDWKAGSEKQAKLHWEQAYRLQPSNPVIANNKAWMLSKSTSAADWQKGLAIVDSALRTTAKNRDFVLTLLDTRGTLHMNLKKWREALRDFESVLRYRPTPEVHKNLGIIYRELGDETLAGEHTRLAKAKADEESQKQKEGKQ